MHTLALPGAVYHVGYVVDDIERAATHWVNTAGAGPFFVFRDFEFLNPEFRGRSIGPKVTLAFGASGDLCIELIQQHDDVASPYREAGPGFHHIGIFETDMKARLAAYAAQGVSAGFRGDFARGGSCAYLDTRAQLGCYLELVEEVPALTGAIAAVKAAHKNWDRRTVFGSF